MGNRTTIGLIFVLSGVFCLLFSIFIGVMYIIKKESLENDYLKIKWE